MRLFHIACLVLFIISIGWLGTLTLNRDSIANVGSNPWGPTNNAPSAPPLEDASSAAPLSPMPSMPSSAEAPLSEDSLSEFPTSEPDTTSTTSVFYNHTAYFEAWDLKDQYSPDRMPRVLIFSWCTEDTHIKFVNAIYWLSCYAHSHGFDIVLDSTLNITGVKRLPGQEDADGWYKDENMWGWIHALMPYLFSEKWDYVFVVGIDSLLNPMHMNFPVWAYDTGHDMTIMDQFYMYVGYNENAMLWKPSDFSRIFLTQLFEYRKGFHLQGDNGPWMEMVLRAIGEELWLEGRGGYGDTCLPHLQLDIPSPQLVKENFKEAVRRMTAYSQCFFRELDRIAGPFGQRKSKHIGFSPTYYATSPTNIYQYIDAPDKLKPMANCFSYYRDPLHKKDHRPDLNCFLFHYNGDKEGMFDKIRGGKCQDPTFDWSTWKYNPNKSADLFFKGYGAHLWHT